MSPEQPRCSIVVVHYGGRQARGSGVRGGRAGLTGHAGKRWGRCRPGRLPNEVGACHGQMPAWMHREAPRVRDLNLVSRDNTAMRMRVRALRLKRRRVPGLVNSELAAIWQADGGH